MTKNLGCNKKGKQKEGKHTKQQKDYHRELQS